MSTLTSSAVRTGPLRIGLVLAVLLGALDIAGGIAGMPGSDGFGLAVSGAMIALGAATVVLVIPAWRGSRQAAVAVAIMRVVASLAGLPAFFFPGLPVFLVVLAASGIVLAVVAAVLIFAGIGRR